jgi:Cu+-exporting ATPase
MTSTCASCCSDEEIFEEQLNKSLLNKTIVSAIFTLPLLAHMFISWGPLHSPLNQLVLCIVPLWIGLNHFGKSAINSIRAKDINMDVLILIGFSSAFIYSLWGYLIGRGHEFLFFETSASIVTYVLIGNVIEHRATKSTSGAIRDFLQLAPSTAKRVRKSGIVNTIEDINVIDISDGDTLISVMGDKIPADGTVLESDALINESLITGESIPVEKDLNSTVYAGTLVEKGSLTFKVTHSGSSTLFSSILKTIQSAKNSKPQIQRIGDKVSSIFVPAVLITSLVTFVTCYFILGINFTDSILRAISVLVVACPCAMGLATPTAVMVAVGRAAKSGILVKGGDIFERFGEIKEVIFDKTGTLTEGNFKVDHLEIFDKEYTSEQIYSFIYTIESKSNHPLAKSLTSVFKSLESKLITDIREEAGLGMSAVFENKNKICFGSFKLFNELKVDIKEEFKGYDLYLFINQRLIAALRLVDEVRNDASLLIDYLNNKKINTTILSGDTERKTTLIGKLLNIKNLYFQKSPSEKLQVIKSNQSLHPVAYVGDGVNDVPSLSAASIGISFAKASSTAINSAGIVILSSELTKIITAHKLSNATISIIKQNLFWAFFYNFTMIPLAVTGVIPPSIAALAMALSDVFVIGNSLRLKFKSL